VLKFGHMSSDLLAYGAADGTLTVCNVSENPSVIKQLEGHSKDVTGRIKCLCLLGLYLMLHDIYDQVRQANITYCIIFNWGIMDQ